MPLVLWLVFLSASAGCGWRLLGKRRSVDVDRKQQDTPTLVSKLPVPQLCVELVDAAMNRLSFVRYSAFSTLRQLIRKRVEAVVQLPPDGGDLQLGPHELVEFHMECVEIGERVNSHLLMYRPRAALL